MISQYLIPALKNQLTGLEVIFDEPPQPIATFPAKQSAVGKVLVHDDGDEVTVYIEAISHGHFSCYDEALSQEGREKLIAEDVLDFLTELFNDRVLLYTSENNRIGGWTRLDLKQGSVELNPSFRYYLWSKPYAA